MKLEEQLTIVSAAKPKLQEHKFEHDPGCSSVGNVIGPINVPAYDQVWHATWAEKKVIYGSANLIGVGGKIDTEG